MISIKNTEIYLELGGIHMQGCRCSERLKTKSRGGENLTLPRWIGDVLKILQNCKIAGCKIDLEIAKLILQ